MKVVPTLVLGTFCRLCVSPIFLLLYFLLTILLDQPTSISSPKQQRLELTPDRWVIPVLTENIGWIRFALDVMETSNIGCHAPTGLVEGQHVMALV